MNILKNKNCNIKINDEEIPIELYRKTNNEFVKYVRYDDYKKLENIIKEVREYIENNSLYEQDYTYDYEENIEEWPPDDTKARKELLEILNKVEE